jgi:uncharacterized protein with HEPN domain
MKTQKKPNQRQRRNTRARVKRGGGGGLHQLIKDEKQLFDLLNVSRFTPPDLRKTSVMLEQVLQILETRMLLIKQYTDIHGFLYIDKGPINCFPNKDDPHKRISPSINSIAECFESRWSITHLSYIKSGFDAEKQLYKHIKEFVAEMRRLNFIAVMQHEFALFGGSFNLGNALWTTMLQIHELHPGVPFAITYNLREIINNVDTAIIAIRHGMDRQIQLLREIKTNAIPEMEKAYREKDSSEWDHRRWETIPVFLHVDGDETVFKQHMETFKQKIDGAIAQKVNAGNPRVEFVDPLNLTHLSHRIAPRVYANGVLQPARAPSHAIAQTVTDIASYDPNITQAQRMSMMRGMRDKLISKMIQPPLQSKFYHKPESTIQPSNP